MAIMIDMFKKKGDYMLKTRELTEASMLSALFVVLSLIAITTGIAYSLYLDILVPIIIGLIYFRCGLKYTILSAITSLLIIVLGLGDVVSGIWMSQGILLGILCGIFLKRDSLLLDDLVLSSLLGCILMIFVDVYFSALTGYSFIAEFEGYSVALSNRFIDPKVILYIFTASIPVGTVIFVYFGTLILGYKLNLLNSFSKNKFLLLKNLKTYRDYLCCSKKIIYFSVIYIGILEVLNMVNINGGGPYIRAAAISIEYLLFYTIISDSTSFIGKFIYIKTKSLKAFRLFGIVTLILLVLYFRITTLFLVIFNGVINFYLHFREKQEILIKRLIASENII